MSCAHVVGDSTALLSQCQLSGEPFRYLLAISLKICLERHITPFLYRFVGFCYVLPNFVKKFVKRFLVYQAWVT